MLRTELLLLPFLIQSLSIFIDEFYFHHQRGLGRWERFGHPLDTLTVILLFIYCLAFNPTNITLMGFIFLSIFSCFFVTKDEFIHKKLCNGQEQWLHSILFLTHSSTCIFLGTIWYNNLNLVLFNFEISKRLFFVSQLILMTLFIVYQILFWIILDYGKKPVTND